MEEIIHTPIHTKKQIWSPETDTIICCISDYSKCMAHLCIYVSEYHQRQRTFLLGPAAVLSWGLTIFGMFATYYGNERLPDASVILINSLLNFIIATFTTVAEKSQAGSKIDLFQQLARDFFNLSGTISMELSKEPKDRVAVNPFVGNMNSRYRDLENSVPPLSQALLHEFTVCMEGKERSNQQQLWNSIPKPNMLSPLSPTDKYHWCELDPDPYADDIFDIKNKLSRVEEEALKEEYDEETGEVVKQKELNV